MIGIGIFAKTFGGATPAEVLGAVGRAGYDFAQYNMACSGIGALPLAVEDATALAVRAASDESAVAIAAISATYNMIHPDVATRQRGRASFAAIASRAHLMGGTLLTVCTGSCDADDQWRFHPDNSGPVAWRTMCEEFEHLLVIADRYDVQIGVEPELANVVSDARRARELIDSLQSKRIKIVLDPANLFEIATPQSRNAIIEQAVDLLGDDIALAHAKDRKADGSFVRAGGGVIDFAHFLATLRGVAFEGAIIAHGLDDSEAPRVARFLRETLASLT